MRVRPRVQGAGDRARQQDRRDSLDGRRVSPIRRASSTATSQSQRQPGSSIKAVHLSRGAACRIAAAEHPRARPAGDVAPRSAATSTAQGKGLLDAEETKATAAASARCGAASRTPRTSSPPNLLDGGIDRDPSQSLARVCELTLDAKIYSQCVSYYPFILGAQPARLIDMAAAYAAIATEGRRPSPYGIRIDRAGRAYGLYPQAPNSSGSPTATGLRSSSCAPFSKA